MSIEAKISASTAAGKYMAFKLAREEYGLEILKVREIIRLMEITPVPKTFEFMRGIINLRGKVIPVVDLRLKFGMDRTVATDQTVIIIVQYTLDAASRPDGPLAGRDLTVGILVDEVLEVLSIAESAIEPPPTFGSASVNSQFILGIGKAEKRVVFLLDLGKVLSADDHAQLAQMAVPPAPASVAEAR